MKKIIVSLLACVCMLGLSGCSSKEEKPEKKEFYALNETIDVEGATLSVNSATKSTGTDFDKPAEGMEYIIVEVTITNTGDNEIDYNPFDYKMQNSQGQIESQAFSIVNQGSELKSGKLAAGGNVTGSIVFEQPIDDTDLTLIYQANMFSGDEYKIKLQ